MNKTKLNSQVILREEWYCVECNEEVDVCDNCGSAFLLNEHISCKNYKHICANCKAIEHAKKQTRKVEK